MSYSRGKVQILYNHLPGALFAHDEYGHCKVTGIDLNELTDVNQAALADVVRDAIGQWREQWQHAGFPPVRNETDLARYFIVGEPTSVRFQPYPRAFVCQRCRRVSPLAELQRTHAQPGRCLDPQCGGSLTQLGFVQAHNCGRLDEIFINRDGCPEHGNRGLYFDDTGRVTTARWRCRLCGGAEISRLRQTPCRCDYTAHGTDDPNEQRLRFFPVTDPAVFKPQICPFVNFPRDEIGRLETPEARPFVLARIWGILGQPVAVALEKESQAGSDKSGEIAELIRALAELKPEHPRVIEWQRQHRATQTEELTPLRINRLLGTKSATELRVGRRMLEQVALLDSLSVTSVSDVATRLEAAGDKQQAERALAGAAWGKSHLGIAELRAIEDFPIGLCGIGFTRVKSDPGQTILTPFPQVGQRTPLYAVVTRTEAIYLQLCPARVAHWLYQNALLPSPPPADPEEAWAKMYHEIPAWGVGRSESSHMAPAAVAVRTLLHTISHVLLRHIEWSGYAAQSVGEYMLPDGLASVLYASRYTDTKVGGLLTLFEQGLGGWLESSHQAGADCVLDPFCAEEGGTCVGCLHREFNCTEFNRELSRAVLYGGSTPQQGQNALSFGPVVEGFWTS
jgi:hypothetical protein